MVKINLTGDFESKEALAKKLIELADLIDNSEGDVESGGYGSAEYNLFVIEVI